MIFIGILTCIISTQTFDACRSQNNRTYFDTRIESFIDITHYEGIKLTSKFCPELFVMSRLVHRLSFHNCCTTNLSKVSNYFFNRTIRPQPPAPSPEHDKMCSGEGEQSRLYFSPLLMWELSLQERGRG